jgi:hypothetical protein
MKNKSLTSIANYYNINVSSITKRPRIMTLNVFLDPIIDIDKTNNMIHDDINIIEAQIPEEDLEKLLIIAKEWHEILRDPESAELLVQARFIQRLKKGNI